MTLITEVGKLAQRDNESVFDYSERLTDLKEELEIAENRDKSGIVVTENCLVKTFIRVLKQEIITRMPRVSKLEDAYRETQRIEKNLIAEKELRSKNTSTKYCVFCNVTSHETLNCEVFLTIKRKHAAPLETTEVHYPTHRKEQCGHCGSTEHTVTNCGKFFSSNIKTERKEPEVITINKIEDLTLCGFCNRPNYTINNCIEYWNSMNSQQGYNTRPRPQGYNNNYRRNNNYNNSNNRGNNAYQTNNQQNNGARQESNARVPQEQTKDIKEIVKVSAKVASSNICESKKAEDNIEIVENDEMAKFYEKTELKEIKHLICGKISEDYNEEEENLSKLKQSHNTISWQNGATIRVQEKNVVIQAHVSEKQSDKMFEDIKENDSKTSLEVVAPTKVLCEQIKDCSKIAEINAKGASPSICRGNKADFAIENLKNKEVAKMYEEEIDNREKIIENVKGDCSEEEIFENINPCDESYREFKSVNSISQTGRYGCAPALSGFGLVRPNIGQSPVRVQVKEFKLFSGDQSVNEVDPGRECRSV
ncbi:hypothetical protein TKK_0005626 [Trichogramma kaykai]